MDLGLRALINGESNAEHLVVQGCRATRYSPELGSLHVHATLQRVPPGSIPLRSRAWNEACLTPANVVARTLTVQVTQILATAFHLARSSRGRKGALDGRDLVAL